MQIENLTPGDAVELEEKLSEMKKQNPDIEYRVLEMGDLKETLGKGKVENEMLQEISDKIDALNGNFNRIFGEHILIKGEFKLPSEIIDGMFKKSG